MIGHRNCGFTLVELSIVMVIIGFIVGGILVGRDLIHNAELRQVLSEESKLVTAVNTFKIKYNCVPGDCANATTFFGTAADCTGATTLTTSGTCNGDGDGKICGPFGDPCGAEGGSLEYMYVAHHLQLANLINLPLTTPGNNTIKYSGFTKQIPGSNIFGSNALSGIGWEARYVPTSTIGVSGLYWFCGSYAFSSGANQWFFAGTSINGPLGSNNFTVPGAVFLTGNDAYNLDTKIDDGKPATGILLSPYYSQTVMIIDNGTNNTCDAVYQNSAQYIHTNNRGSGGLVFVTNF